MNWLRRLFRLAEGKSPPHIARPGEAPVKEERVDTKASVAGLLGSAAGAAEAMMDCGIDVDDTELATAFVETMAKVHAEFVQHVTNARNGLLATGTPEGDLNDLHTAIRISMQHSPAFTSPWFMWRLAAIVKTMASRDVLEAAQMVVARAEETPEIGSARLQSAIAKLAATLPKED